ncbi:hypothetical protein AB0J21_09250 [Streptomyces sp. NPDC049954]|uniref:hypothetical protein n=1 Tax=Streptomyces sp. NPDC049954 TaxID=3155779 RepID=UPI003412C01A
MASNTPMRALTPQVPSCVMVGIGRSESALAVDKGTYHGRGAYLVLLPHTSDATRVAAYVVDASCVRNHTTTPGKVLLSASYTRR